MSSQGRLTAVLCVIVALTLAACGDDSSSDGFSSSSPTPAVTPTATPRSPTDEPFSCVAADCGPDVTCASLGFVNPLKHCYLYNDQYLCCRQSPFE